MVPNGWKRVPIKEVCHSIIDCVNKTAPVVDYETPYKMIRTSNVRNGKINTLDVRYVTKETYEQWTRRGAPLKGDVILTREAPVGEVGLLENAEGIFLGQRLMMYRANKKIADNYFLFYSLSSAFCQKQIEDYSNGGTVAHMRVPDCGEILVNLPPLSEQNKIAQILSTWDQAISATEKLLENSKQQKKALMQQLLTGKKRLLDENGVNFSNEWEKVHIKDCAECLDNKRVPLNSEQRSLMSGSIPYWGANGIVDYISDFIFDETIVLLAEDGGYFDEYQTRPISNISYGKCWVNNHAHILRAKKNSLNEWIYYCLVHKNILAFVNGGTRAKLNKSDMLMIPLLLPSLQEQKKIVSLLSLADQEIENLQKKLDCLKQEKKALMQQLLTGKRVCV